MSNQYEVEMRTSSPFLLLDCANTGSVSGLVMDTSAPYSNLEPSKGAVLMGAKPTIDFVRNEVTVEADYDAEASKLDALIKLGVPARGIYVSGIQGGYFAEAEANIHSISLTVGSDYLGVGFLASDNESFLGLDVDMSILSFAADSLRSRICKKIADHDD